MKKTKTSQTDYFGTALLLILAVLVHVQIVCAVCGDTSVVAPWSMIAYVICAIAFVSKVSTAVEKNKILRCGIGFLLLEAMQIVPYVIILYVKGLL